MCVCTHIGTHIYTPSHTYIFKGNATSFAILWKCPCVFVCPYSKEDGLILLVCKGLVDLIRVLGRAWGCSREFGTQPGLSLTCLLARLVFTQLLSSFLV